MGHFTLVFACAGGIALTACGSVSEARLFPAGAGPGTGGTAGLGGSAAGSGSSGGGASSGGRPGSGGAGGFGVGGSSAFGTGGGGGSGAGGVQTDASTTLCDYTGTWGTYITVPVSWPDAPFILIGGTGILQQWDLTEQVQQGADVHSRTVPCMIFLPDLQSSLFGGFYKYGIRFPIEIFDRGGIPPTDFVLHGSVSASGIFVQTDPFAILVGLTLANPTTAVWPGTHYLSLADQDLDGSPGVTVIPALDPGYSLPPVDLSGNYADRIHIAERTVSRLYGPLTSCDQVDLAVEILPVGTATGIQSSVVGCHVQNGADCTLAQSDFVDGIRPQYTPTAVGTSTSVRLPAGSTCADVRARFPVR